MNAQRALLLTDLVDSTQLVERLGDAAAAELSAAHDRVARDLLRQWRGREIDKTDGMLMMFDSAADAVACALAYHAALAALPVARIGVVTSGSALNGSELQRLCKVIAALPDDVRPACGPRWVSLPPGILPICRSRA